MKNKTRTLQHLYEKIAEDMAGQIQAGRYQPGDKIPGTRLLAESFGVSINTILQTQKVLENRGFIEAKPRSGFYVKLRPVRLNQFEPAQLNTNVKPALIRRQKITLELIQVSHQIGMVQLGSGLPSPAFLPTRQLQRITGKISRHREFNFSHYDAPPGLASLREALSLRMLGMGCQIDQSENLITSGCHESLSIALKCVTEPGDVVLIESPTYSGLLQIMDAQGLRAITIPHHPETAINFAAIENACKKWTVKACVIINNYSYSPASTDGDNHKAALLELLNQYRVPLIEDDIFGDLGFSGLRPAPYKKFDSRGEVLYCNSFSKSVSPGLRVGWLSPGRYIEKASYIKLADNIATSSINQKILDEFLRNGHLDKHLRSMRAACARNIHLAIQFIRETFPKSTKTAQPQGGYFLWLKLPSAIKVSGLYEKALQQKLYLVPGKLFSSEKRLDNTLRLNCALPWETELKPALSRLAKLMS